MSGWAMGIWVIGVRVVFNGDGDGEWRVEGGVACLDLPFSDGDAGFGVGGSSLSEIEGVVIKRVSCDVDSGRIFLAQVQASRLRVQQSRPSFHDCISSLLCLRRSFLSSIFFCTISPTFSGVSKRKGLASFAMPSIMGV